MDYFNNNKLGNQIDIFIDYVLDTSIFILSILF